MISDEERSSILNTHRSFYDGYATGNVPSNQTPLTVEDLAQDKGGIQVTNTGEVKTYNNNIHEQAIIPADDMDVSDVEPAFDFVSDGPLDGETVEGEDNYEMDIKGIMDMFGGEMSQSDKEIVFGDEEFVDISDDESDPAMMDLDDYFEDSPEGNPYDYIENGGFMDEEMCEQCGSEMSEGECSECGMYEEVDEDLQESFKTQRKTILETFNRLNKFN